MAADKKFFIVERHGLLFAVVGTVHGRVMFRYETRAQAEAKAEALNKLVHTSVPSAEQFKKALKR